VGEGGGRLTTFLNLQEIETEEEFINITAVRQFRLKVMTHK
jgi:hypothetical protein